MFPKWNDWDLQYTRKGLWKKRAKRTLEVIVAASVVIGAVRFQRSGLGALAGLQHLNRLLRRYIKQSLFSVWGIVNRGIQALPD